MSTAGLTSDIVAPSLLHGWANVGSGAPDAGYYKDPHGHVHLVGEIEGGMGLSAFVLPVGFRPGEPESFAIASTSIAFVTVDTDGTVTPSTNFVRLKVKFLAVG